jgi:hypothetical protein
VLKTRLRLRPLHVALLMSLFLWAAPASAQEVPSVSASTSIYVCVPGLGNQTLETCEDYWARPLDAALAEPLANWGDNAEWTVPDADACWMATTDPAWRYLDHDTATYQGSSWQTILAGCSENRPGGTTVYYHKQRMHDGYNHSGNYNHKKGHWMRLYHENGCSYYLCHYHLYMTNWRNRVKHNWWYRMSGPGYMGTTVPRIAARPYCGWQWEGSLNQAHPLVTVACLYTYG